MRIYVKVFDRSNQTLIVHANPTDTVLELNAEENPSHPTEIDYWRDGQVTP